MGWVYLVIAGLLEIGFTTFLKMTEGFTKMGPTGIFLIFTCASFFMLNVAMLTIPLGIAYAVWTGIGAAGTIVMSAFYFGETLSCWQVFFLTTLIGSIVGLKALSS